MNLMIEDFLGQRLKLLLIPGRENAFAMYVLHSQRYNQRFKLALSLFRDHQRFPEIITSKCAESGCKSSDKASYKYDDDPINACFRQAKHCADPIR